MNELTTTQTIPAEFRDINTITAEIHMLQRQAIQMELAYAIEVGRRLNEAKEMIPHGEWGAWLKTEVNYSERTAQNLMKIFREYGTDQINLFGAAKTQSLADLSYTKALRLLAVPEEEREEFIKENNVESMTSRELEAAIRERDEAKKKAEELKEANDKIRHNDVELNKELTATIAKASEAKAEAEKFRTEAEKAKEEIRKLKDAKPTIPASEIERIGKEAAEKAEKDLAAKIQKAERAADAAKAEAEQLRKQLAMSDTDMATFRVHFEAVQNELNTMNQLIIKIEKDNPENGAKMRAAVKKLLETFGQMF